MAIATRGSIGNSLSPFFKGEDFAGYLVLIFEPKANTFKKDVEGTYGPRDQINAVVTAFKTQGALERGEPTVQKEYTINVKSIVSDLKEKVDEDSEAVIIATLEHYQPKKQGARKTWVLRDTTEESDWELAVAYVEKRDAAVEAALAEVPNFDDV